MTRRVVVTGLGPVSGIGLGIEPTWEAALAGRSGIGPIDVFDAGGFDCRIAAEVRDFKIRDFVPKSYRKATKVMASDIEMAVAAALLAARDAGLITACTDPDATPTYDPGRVGCHIGAGLIAAEVNELTSAMAEATDDDGNFDIHKWGSEGMFHLTPLWLLKYLPNMLACHVTIVHDCQGPSNTITCAEASAILSIGESLRVIQRGAADACFCGGAEDKLNPMALLRQHFSGNLNTTSNDDPTAAVRPFDKKAAGTVVGQGGAIVILESLETFEKRRAAAKGDAGSAPDQIEGEPSGHSSTTPHAYAEVVGFGASQTVNPQQRNLAPDAAGKGIALAIEAALREANVSADAIDLVIPFGIGVPAYDNAEAAALRRVLGDRAADVPVVSAKPLVGNTAAGAGGIDVTLAAKALATQTIPATINCDAPLADLHVKTAPSRPAQLRHVLTYNTSFGGQNAALLIKRFEA